MLWVATPSTPVTGGPGSPMWFTTQASLFSALNVSDGTPNTQDFLPFQCKSVFLLNWKLDATLPLHRSLRELFVRKQISLFPKNIY